MFNCNELMLSSSTIHPIDGPPSVHLCKCSMTFESRILSTMLKSIQRPVLFAVVVVLLPTVFYLVVAVCLSFGCMQFTTQNPSSFYRCLTAPSAAPLFGDHAHRLRYYILSELYRAINAVFPAILPLLSTSLVSILHS